MTRLRLLCLLLAAALIAGGGSALAAPRPGRLYTGTSKGGAPVRLRVAHDGQSVRYYDIRFRAGRCTGGRVFSAGLAGERVPLHHGAFSLKVPGYRSSYLGHAGRYRLSASGRFVAGGSEVRGTIGGRFSGRRFSCRSGSVGFRAFLPAPRRNASVSSGTYGAAGRALAGVRLLVDLPSRRVIRVSFRWTARCQRKIRLPGVEDFRALPLRGSRFGLRGRARTPLGAHTFSHESFVLAGRFFRASGVYRVQGTWKLSSLVTRRGARSVRCSTGTLAFSGRHR